MDIKITFQNMPHSDSLQQHTEQKLEKLTDLVQSHEQEANFRIEVSLKANKQHPHHGVDIHLKTAHYALHVHDEGADMYVVVDTTIDKMVHMLKKEKKRYLDKVHKPETDKRNFYK